MIIKNGLIGALLVSLLVATLALVAADDTQSVAPNTSKSITVDSCSSSGTRTEKIPNTNLTLSKSSADGRCYGSERYTTRYSAHYRLHLLRKGLFSKTRQYTVLDITAFSDRALFAKIYTDQLKESTASEIPFLSENLRRRVESAHKFTHKVESCMKTCTTLRIDQHHIFQLKGDKKLYDLVVDEDEHDFYETHTGHIFIDEVQGTAQPIGIQRGNKSANDASSN